jgi:hypothetical protein
VRDYEQDEDEHSGQAAMLDPGSGSRAPGCGVLSIVAERASISRTTLEKIE